MVSTVQEFCQWESFNVTCRENEFILVTSARYGRMKVGRCLPIDYFLGCAVDVQPQLEARCSGKKNCTVAVSDRDLFRVQPCRKDLVAYLEAGYRCVSGKQLHFVDELVYPHTVTVTQPALCPHSAVSLHTLYI